MILLNTLRGQLKNNELMRNNLIFFVGSLVIAVFNYAYYPVLSRLVPVTEFGEIQAVISLFMQLGIILTAFGYVITNIISNAVDDKESNVLVLRLEQAMLVASILLFALLLVASSALQNSFKLHSVIPIILVGLLIVINIPATARSYVLQGAKRLREVSTGGVIFTSGKLLLTTVFIWVITDNVSAAVLGYIVAQILMLFYLNKRLSGHYKSLGQSFSPMYFKNMTAHMKKLIRSEVIYGLVIFVVLSGLTLLYTSDTIIARLFFDPYTLGVYSGISSVARIVFFITASVAGVLIATVNFNVSQKENHHTLLRSLSILTLVGGAVVALFCFFPRQFVEILVGGDYVYGTKWLPLLSIVMLLCSVNNLLATYQIALRKYTSIIPVMTGVVTLVLGLAFFHATPEEFISVLLVSNLVVFVFLGVPILKENKAVYRVEKE